MQLQKKISWFADNLTPTERLAYFVGTVGGAGDSPVAPGTAGSIVGVLVYLWMGGLNWPVQLLIIILTIVVGLWAAQKMESHSGIHDDGRIVIDEVIGVWLSLFAFPVSIPFLIAGFLLFRILDIVKPFPANWIDQRWPGARGVIFDDVVSGIYAQAALRFLIRLWGVL